MKGRGMKVRLSVEMVARALLEESVSHGVGVDDEGLEGVSFSSRG